MLERFVYVGDQVIFYWIRLIKTHMRTVFKFLIFLDRDLGKRLFGCELF